MYPKFEFTNLSLANERPFSEIKFLPKPQTILIMQTFKKYNHEVDPSILALLKFTEAFMEGGFVERLVTTGLETRTLVNLIC